MARGTAGPCAEGAVLPLTHSLPPPPPWQPPPPPPGPRAGPQVFVLEEADCRQVVHVCVRVCVYVRVCVCVCVFVKWSGGNSLPPSNALTTPFPPPCPRSPTPLALLPHIVTKHPAPCPALRECAQTKRRELMSSLCKQRKFPLKHPAAAGCLRRRRRGRRRRWRRWRRRRWRRRRQVKEAVRGDVAFLKARGAWRRR